MLLRWPLHCRIGSMASRPSESKRHSAINKTAKKIFNGGKWRGQTIFLNSDASRWQIIAEPHLRGTVSQTASRG
jgi:hypothetical protein